MAAEGLLAKIVRFNPSVCVVVKHDRGLLPPELARHTVALKPWFLQGNQALSNPSAPQL